MALAEITEAYMRAAELADALKQVPLNKHPGCWECQVDKQWFIAINGHPEAKIVRRPGLKSGTEVPHSVDPFRCYIEFNGWPAGILDPYGGVIAAGSAANEDTFIAALDARIAAAKAGG